jgi:hypothetical protein
MQDPEGPLKFLSPLLDAYLLSLAALYVLLEIFFLGSYIASNEKEKVL